MSDTSTASNSGPGYAKHPGHTIRLEPCPQRVRAVLNGETIADTTRALAMLEGDYEPRYYVPRDDVRSDLVSATETDTYCPFKGTASYWTFTTGDRVSEDAAWSYETPYDEMMAIKGYFCFYDDRVDDLIIDDPA